MDAAARKPTIIVIVILVELAANPKNGPRPMRARSN
jgi:hypothetical protein